LDLYLVGNFANLSEEAKTNALVFSNFGNKFLEVNPDFIPPSFDREKGPYAKSFKHNTAWKDKKNKIPKTSKLGKFRKVINKIKDFSRKNKKIYYFMKRNMCLDFYYQWLSRRL